MILTVSLLRCGMTWPDIKKGERFGAGKARPKSLYKR